MSPSLKDILDKYRNKKKNGLIQEIKHKHKDLITEIEDMTNFLDEESTLSERLYCIINDIKSKPLCICGKQCAFNKINRGFYKTCNSPECIKKIRSISSIESNKKKDWNKIVKKIQDTNLKKIGYVSNFSSGSITRKTYDDIIEKKYGSKHVLKNKDILKKQQQTTLLKYGTLNMLGTDKVKQTIKERYNVDHPMKNKTIAKNSGRKSSDVKNGNLLNKIKEMNLSIISFDKNFYTLKCNYCGKTLNNVTRYLINYTYKNKKTPCHHCFPENHFRSKGEQEIVNEIKKFYSNEIQLNRQYLGTEVDIIIPDKKLCIEFNGVYWHSELFKHKNYHKDKKILIESKGYDLIQIWEDDWNDNIKRNIIISRIKSKLNLLDKKIFARKCEIKNVNNIESKNFLKNNHIQGYAAASIKLGLYYNDELVSIATFSKSRNSIGGNKDSYELIRYASKINYNVIGGFSKLIKHFSKTYNKNIYTYADCDWTSLNNSVYSKCGFILNKHTDPGYFWVLNGLRCNRLLFQKHKIVETKEDLTKTEYEIMTSKGYYRVWNSGNLLFTFDTKN